MSDIDGVLNDISPNLKDGPVTPAAPAPTSDPDADYDDVDLPQPKSKPVADDFPEEDYESEDDAEFDPDKATPEQKKVWPKKFRNALAQRKNEIAKLRAEIAASKASPQNSPAAATTGAQANAQPTPEANYSPEQKAKLEKIVSDKPLLKDFKDYGEFVEKLTAWNAKVQIAEHNFTLENQQKVREADIATSRNEERIIKQSQELIKKHPEYLELVRDNADVLSQIDQLPHVKKALGIAERPELAFYALASTPGALQALAQMDATSAIRYVAKAEMVGERMLSQAGETDEGSDDAIPEPQQRSQAPKPLRASKGVRTGRKSADQMSADELDEVLGFSNI